MLIVFAIAYAGAACAEATDEAFDAASDENKKLIDPTPPATADDQWQIGVGRMIYWSGEDPLINLLAMNNGRPGRKADWPADVFDPETQAFLKFPDGQNGIKIGLLRGGAGANPDFYKGEYIIEWDGEGQVGTTLKAAGVVTREGPNRVREVYTGLVAGAAAVKIRQIGPGGVSNIRVYRAENEAALKQGKVFNPAFVEYIARYDIVRTMDWNSFKSVTRADQIAGMGAQFWGGGIVPIEAQFKLAEEAGVALWLNAPDKLGAPDGLLEQLASMRKGRQAERKALTAANFDAVDASAEWDNYAALVVAAMDKTGYPLDRHFYLELANETWNWGGAFNATTEWYWSLTVALKEKTGSDYPGNPSRGAYGYFAARLAEAFAKALDQAGRGGQTVAALQGVADYQGGANLQPMARYGVATTGYYRGLFSHGYRSRIFGEKLSPDEWRAEWLRRFNQDPDAFAQFLSDAMDDDQSQIQNVEWVVGKSLGHHKAALDFGARYIGQYEGSSHDTLDKELRKIPEVLAFYKAWQAGPHHAAIIRLHAKRMGEELPGVVLSNYQHWSIGGISPGGPWLFNTQWGEETEAERALFEAIGDDQ